MLDSFLEVTYEQEKTAEADNQLVESMKNLPQEMLMKIASGEMKLSCGCGDEWLDKFKGTPLLGKAIEFEKKGLEQEMARKAKRRQREEMNSEENTGEDQLRVERKMLELELASAACGPQAMPENVPAAPEPAASVKTAVVTGTLPAETQKTFMQKLRGVERSTVEKYREAGKKWGRKRGAKSGATRGASTGAIAGTLAGLAASKGGRRLGALKGLAVGALGGTAVGGGTGAVRGGKAGKRVGERAGQIRNVRRRMAINAKLRQLASQRSQKTAQVDVEQAKEAFVSALGGKVIGLAGKAFGAIGKPGAKKAFGQKVRGAATSMGGEGGTQALGTRRLKSAVGVGTLGVGAAGAGALIGGRRQ